MFLSFILIHLLKNLLTVLVWSLPGKTWNVLEIVFPWKVMDMFIKNYYYMAYLDMHLFYNPMGCWMLLGTSKVSFFWKFTHEYEIWRKMISNSLKSCTSEMIHLTQLINMVKCSILFNGGYIKHSGELEVIIPKYITVPWRHVNGGSFRQEYVTFDTFEF